MMPKHEYKLSRLLTFVGVAAGSVAISSLLSIPVSAKTSQTENIRYTVPVSCSFSGIADHAHTAVLNPGDLTSDIGSTVFNASCNDSTGFAIYAVGYTGDVLGTTTLQYKDRALSTNDIATGVPSSGNNTSLWSMKITKQDTAQDSLDLVNNGFDSYHAIPSVYTKVASRPAFTDAAGSSFVANYQVYTATDQVAGEYEGKVKYALLHPGVDKPDTYVTLQSFSCSSLVNIGDSVELEDERDKNVYTVAKLADGRCWMTKNLRLDLGASYANITVENTNNPTQAFLDRLAVDHAPTNSGNWSTMDYGNAILYNNADIGNETIDSWGDSFDEYGIYYSWYTATAGNGSSSMSYSDGGSAAGDLCPKGWHLPTGQNNSAYDPVEGDYGRLFVALGGPTNYRGMAADAAYRSSTPSGLEMGNRFRSAPNNFTIARFYYDGRLNAAGFSEYWTSTAYTASYGVYTFGISGHENNGTWPGTMHNYGYKYTGHAMRCIANE